jgi:hypothetical protein
MKNEVSIEIQNSTQMSDRMTVRLNGVTRGIVDINVEKQQSPVLPALVLLGFDAVHIVDESGRQTRYSSADLLRERPALYAGPMQETRGLITLTLRWSEPLEAYRFDVSHNGTRLESVDAKLTIGTLRKILVQLGYTVTYVEDIAKAA